MTSTTVAGTSIQRVSVDALGEEGMIYLDIDHNGSILGFFSIDARS